MITLVVLVRNLLMSTQTPRHRLRVPILDAHAFVFRRHLFVCSIHSRRPSGQSLALASPPPPLPPPPSSHHPRASVAIRTNHRPVPPVHSHIRRVSRLPIPRAHRIIDGRVVPHWRRAPRRRTRRIKTPLRESKRRTRNPTIVSPHSRRVRAFASRARRRTMEMKWRGLGIRVSARPHSSFHPPHHRDARDVDVTAHDAPSALQKTTASFARHAAHVGIESTPVRRPRGRRAMPRRRRAVGRRRVEAESAPAVFFFFLVRTRSVGVYTRVCEAHQINQST